MPDLSTFLTFYAAVLAIQLSPGPDMVLVIGRGVGQGRRTAFLSAVGMTIVAGAAQLMLLTGGVASLLAASPLAFEILRWAGACYLVWLGAKLLLGPRGGARAADAAQPAAVSDCRAIGEGAVSNLTNPKALAFLFAFLPQFVEPGSPWPVWAQLLMLGAITKLSNFVILGAVALASGTFGGWLSQRPQLIRWQERFAGLVMIALGVKMMLGGDVRTAARSG